MIALTLTPLAITALPLVAAASYPLLESWSGKGFLDGWNYDPSPYDNTTSGDVFWATAANTSLIYTTDAGTVIMKVDNTTVVPYNEKRYAPKLLSKTAYQSGTVWIMDAIHMPYGCSVWPAFWTQGPNWPAGGEIDIMEGINGQTTNQIALHADGDQCMASNGTITGQLTLNNCSIAANSGSGCTTTDKNTNSYGQAFAAAGGGVYAAEFTTDAIRVWFFTRSAVPSELKSDAKTIDTSSFGTPVAEYDGSSCDISKSFGAQTLTIDITLCGAWAGVASLLEETCPPLVGTNTCYTTYVINDAAATYANAYFELNYVNVYSSVASSSSDPSQTGSATNTITAGPGSSGGAASSGSARPLRQWEGAGAGWVGMVVGGMVLGLSLVL